jgi:cyclohexanone monooxygenase
MAKNQQDKTVDAVVVGAGFSGLYLILKLRELGLSFRAFEAGSGVGGTWYWNRYPGARCDVESMQYSYSFDEDLQQEWKWSEVFAGQPEIMKYANHVADRFALRDDIEFNTNVVSAHFNEVTNRWAVTLESGEIVHAQYCIMATGCLSSPRAPDFKGMESFKGATYHTGEWPHDDVDLSGLRVGVIGTGSSAIQAIPVIAEQAGHVTVFQRTPNYSIPSRNGAMSPEYADEWKSEYQKRREIQRTTPNGNYYERSKVGAMDVSDAERRRIYEKNWEAGGTQFMAGFKDLSLNQAANDTAAEFVRERICEIVDSAETAELLAPDSYPIGTKRICVDTRYFETFNRDNVRLVDISKCGIDQITENGVRAGGEDFEFDAIVYATGFDAMTGTLLKIDIQGRDGLTLREKWEAGPVSYLGIMVAGFPNMYTITGPGSPSVLCNMMVAIEQHVEFVADSLGDMQARGADVIEADPEAEAAWVEHGIEVAYKTLYPKAASWYMGANIEGKPRVFMPYIGGMANYAAKCRQIVADGYPGFIINEAASAAKSA